MKKHTDSTLGIATAEDILYFASESSKNTTGQIVVEDFSSSPEVNIVEHLLGI